MDPPEVIISKPPISYFLEPSKVRSFFQVGDVGVGVLGTAAPFYEIDIPTAEEPDVDAGSVSGALTFDDTDPLDVAFDFDPDSDLTEGTTYTVDLETYDFAGNGHVSDTWDFTTGFTNIAPSSVGLIKACFVE